MSAAPVIKPSDYQAIRIGSLSGNYPTNFDTYIKAGPRFVLYCRNGDVFDEERLFRLKQKNVTELFILKTDLPAYELYLDRHIVEAYHFSPGAALEARAEKIMTFNRELIEKFFANPEDIEVYLELKGSSRHFIEFVTSEQQSLKALLDVPHTDLKISQHGVRVAALAVAFAQAKNMVDKNRPTYLMVMGAFLHDIEFGTSSFEFRRPITAFSKEEKKEYRKHPSNGAQKVQTFGHMDKLVVQIILQHEEQADGTGFPKGLREADMDPSVLIVAASNVYDRFVTFDGLTPKDAYKNLLIEKMGAFELPFLQGLQQMLKARGIVTS
jgi:HD-GYP domain-containing protein (c-di-GMP phosphodiesterase class II)